MQETVAVLSHFFCWLAGISQCKSQVGHITRQNVIKLGADASHLVANGLKALSHPLIWITALASGQKKAER